MYFSKISRDSNNIVANLTHQRSDSKPKVDISGIHVEHHVGRNRECFICVRFEYVTLGEKESRPALLEDPLMSETYALEENASHY